MPYIYCEKCGGYYQLAEGESLEDFEICQCGGDLVYRENLEEIFEENSEEHMLPNPGWMRVIGVVIGSIIMIVPYFIFSPYPQSVPSVFNTNITFLIWIIAGFSSSIISNAKLSTGVSNGLIIASISAFIAVYLFFGVISNYFTSASFYYNLGNYLGYALTFTGTSAIFSILGGLIGALSRKMIETKIYSI